MKFTIYFFCISLLFTTSCIRHELTIKTNEEFSNATINAKRQPVKKIIIINSFLACEFIMTGWKRGPDGEIIFLKVNQKTPLPFWQRFPLDFFADVLIPKEITIKQTFFEEPQKAQTISKETLDQEALMNGYSELNNKTNKSKDTQK